MQGGVHEDLRIASAQEIAARPVDGIAIGGSLGADKPQMYEVVGWAISAFEDDDRPRHLLGIGDVDDLIRGVELGVDTFDCAMPTRLGRHGVALISDPDKRWRVDLTGARWKHSHEPIMEGCPCPSCEAGYTRGYLRYLFKQRELTAVRLLTVHNLAYIARLMADLRQADRERHARRARRGATRRRRTGRVNHLAANRPRPVRGLKCEMRRTSG